MRRIRILLLALVIIGEAAAIGVLFHRFSFERRLNRVEIAGDQAWFQALAAQNGMDFRVLARRLRHGGMTALVVREKARTGAGSLRMWSGFSAADLRVTVECGFRPLLLVEDFTGQPASRTSALLAAVKKWRVGAVIFQRSKDFHAPASADGLARAASFFARHGVVAVIREENAASPVADAIWLDPLVSAFDYRVAKYFLSTWKFVRAPATATADVIDQWARAVAERNVRVIYVKPLSRLDRSPKRNLDETLRAVSGIAHRAASLGLEPGPVKGLGEFHQAPPVLFLLALGVLAGGLFLAGAIAPIKASWLGGALILGIAGDAAFCFLPWPARLWETARQALALLAALIFPVMAANYLAKTAADRARSARPGGRNLIRPALVAYFASAAIALAGGLLIASLLADSAYMLKLQTYRGVKISMLLPLCAAALLYTLRAGFFVDGQGRPLPLRAQAQSMLRRPIRAREVCLALTALFLLVLLLIRSGNTDLPVSLGLEQKFRAVLERALVARPRTKELLAFPLLMLLCPLAERRLRLPAFLALMAGMVGLTDLVNSFCHLHTPLLIAAGRTAYALVFGAAAGTLMIPLLSFLFLPASSAEPLSNSLSPPGGKDGVGS